MNTQKRLRRMSGTQKVFKRFSIITVAGKALCDVVPAHLPDVALRGYLTLHPHSRHTPGQWLLPSLQPRPLTPRPGLGPSLAHRTDGALCSGDRALGEVGRQEVLGDNAEYPYSQHCPLSWTGLVFSSALPLARVVPLAGVRAGLWTCVVLYTHLHMHLCSGGCTQGLRT